MNGGRRWRPLCALLMAAVLALAVAACGGGNDNGTSTTGASSGTLIQNNPDNHGIQLTIGSKNFTEEFVLGEIYAQALQAAGYDVSKDLNLGDSEIAVKALENGQISGYPDYTSTVLEEFFAVPVNQVPSDAQAAANKANQEFQTKGLTSFAPTPFADANAVGMLSSKAQELGVTTVSDLQGKSQDLTLYGSPECRQREDCLLGLEDGYGLHFKSFTPVDIGLRYTVLDKGQADVSILFTSDAQLSASNKYTLLKDDKGVFPAGNVIFITDPGVVQKAGPDYQATIEKVQQGMTLPVIQELNARVDIDKETPALAAQQYLKSAGYIK
jgi:glycine betaine/choline ABC-type transport system substrate-binding protein